MAFRDLLTVSLCLSFPTRKKVHAANLRRLVKIKGEPHKFVATDSGNATIVDKMCLFPDLLELKVNARVILLKNMTGGLVNGSTGTVESFEADHGGSILYPKVRFDNGVTQVIRPETWENEDKRE
jgi:hypothetical protein